jgi:hypothetical protein
VKLSRKRLILATLVLLPLVLGMLILSRSPSTSMSPSPSVREVDAARALYNQVRNARELPGPQHVVANWAELDAVAGMGGRALGFDRVRFVRDGRRAQLRASVPAGLGFWLNIRGYVEPDRNGDLRIRGHLGRLPVPAFLAHGVIALSRQVLRLRGAEVPPLHQMVQQFSLGDAGLAANLNLPRRSRLMSTLSGLQSDSVEPARVAAHYCRLVENQQTAPSEDLVEQVRRAFIGGDGTAADNRSVFVALSLLVAGIDAGSLPEGTPPLLERCGEALGSFGCTDVGARYACFVDPGHLEGNFRQRLRGLGLFAGRSGSGPFRHVLRPAWCGCCLGNAGPEVVGNGYRSRPLAAERSGPGRRPD